MVTLQDPGQWCRSKYSMPFSIEMTHTDVFEVLEPGSLILCGKSVEMVLHLHIWIGRHIDQNAQEYLI